MPTANEIRQQFIDFFVKKHGHTFVPSSPVVPQDDPTLLFTNAGMNQFKDVFLGTGTRPYTRAANTQKCIRAGGKHNDLDDVGKDTYHHTFFEMLGNWSFGDYFKKEAIAWAWELLTHVWKLDGSRLHATVFEGDPDQGLERDEEAFNFWKSETDIHPSHIHWGNKKDNFWEMGDTGPCGPCSEIHYDRTAEKSGGKLVNAGSALVIEIWNLVFIQFNSYYPDPQGLKALRTWDTTPEVERAKLPYRFRDEIVATFRKLSPLPAKHVDTGMGFERVTAVLQKKESNNYETDIFTPILAAIQKVTGAAAYTGKLDTLKDTAYRVIADHIRALTFALTDGAVFSNEGRGYVLRSILRRAQRYGWQHLDTKGPFLYKLVDSVVANMAVAFPELENNPKKVKEQILEEERSFLRTLELGIKRFQEHAGYAIMSVLKDEGNVVSVRFEHDQERLGTTSLTLSKIIVRRDQDETVIELPRTAPELQRFYASICSQPPVISGDSAFNLHTTHGLFIDIVEQMATEAGMMVDRAGFEKLFADFQEQSRMDRKKVVTSAVQGDLPKTDDSLKYEGLKAEAKVLGWVEDNKVFTGGLVPQERKIELILDQTCFYAEAGGQVGDFGVVEGGTGKFNVVETKKVGDTVLHIGQLDTGSLEVGQAVQLRVVETPRLSTMRNHTATHLLNWALRKILGAHVDQKGSLVDQSRTRFDFSHDKPVAPEDIEVIEDFVNDRIFEDLPVTPSIMPLVEAKNIPNVRAVFGEKYPDPVRVIKIVPTDPSALWPFASVEFCGGTHVRRTSEIGLFKIISQEAVGKGVRRLTAVTGRGTYNSVKKMAKEIGELTDRVADLHDKVKKQQQELKKGAATDLQSAADKLLASAVDVNGAKIIIGEMPAGPDEPMRQQVDRLRQKAGSAVVVLGWPTDEGKVQLLAAVTGDLIKKGLHAGKLVGQVAKVVGGGGGGKPDLAQAGGKEPAKLGEALELARKLASEQLK